MSNDDDKPIDGLVINAIRGLLLVVVPVATIIVSVLSAKAAIVQGVEANRMRLEHYVDINDRELLAVQKRLDDLDKRISDHTTMGVDGVGHPLGTSLKIAELQKSIIELQGKLDMLIQRGQ